MSRSTVDSHILSLPQRALLRPIDSTGATVDGLNSSDSSLAGIKVLPLKRAVDIILASIGLLFLLPFTPLIGLAIYIDSPGPIL